MIKLNGQPYFSKDEIFSIIEKHIISIELADYYEVSSAIGDIKVEVADDVAKKLADFQTSFDNFFEKENYMKIDEAIKHTNSRMYDPRKISVCKYKTGSFGVKILAEHKEIVRYVYNVCLEVFKKEFRLLR